MEGLSQSGSTAWLPQETKQLFTCLIPVIAGSCCVGYMLLLPLQLLAKTPTCSCSSHHRPRVSAVCSDSCCWPSALSSHAGLTSSWHLVLAAHTPAQDGISKEDGTDHHDEAQVLARRADWPCFMCNWLLLQPFISHLAPPQPPSPSRAFICWCSSTQPLPTLWALRFACLSVAESWFAHSYLIALHSLLPTSLFLVFVSSCLSSDLCLWIFCL